jgi:hypothetical protein
MPRPDPATAGERKVYAVSAPKWSFWFTGRNPLHYAQQEDHEWVVPFAIYVRDDEPTPYAVALTIPTDAKPYLFVQPVLLNLQFGQPRASGACDPSSTARRSETVGACVSRWIGPFVAFRVCLTLTSDVPRRTGTWCRGAATPARSRGRTGGSPNWTNLSAVAPPEPVADTASVRPTTRAAHRNPAGRSGGEIFRSGSARSKSFNVRCYSTRTLKNEL